MNTGKFVGIISLAALVSLGIGFAIGSSMCKRGTNAPNMSDLENKNVDELNVMLSDVMLPQDEFDKLSSAILQSAMGLFMAQAQGAGINVGDTATNELKNKIEAKYSRKYFSDINAESMKDLSKEELVAILSFYGTDAGQKFLKLSPEIIQKTMSTVQADLSSWLPNAVNEVVIKLKGGDSQAAPGGDSGNDEAAQPMEDGAQE